MVPEIQFYFEGDAYFADLCPAVANAKKTIDFAIYYISDDRIGSHFTELLIKKAKEGVKIRVIYDAVGCMSTDSDLFESMEKAGIEVRAFNKLFPPRHHFSRRDHRKLLVVDHEIGFFGGYNIGCEYLESTPEKKCWRDTGACVRSPDLVKQLSDAFEVTWIPTIEVVRQIIKSKLQKPDWSKASAYVVGSHLWERRSAIRDEYLRAIAFAKKEVFLTNPYFIPDQGMRKVLQKTAERGVDVRLITTGPTDVKVAKWAGEATYSRLMKAGVRIYEYQPRILHAKSCVIDGEWFTVGSSNINHLSFFGNLEINLFGRVAELAKDMRDHFEIDLNESKELNLQEWKQRSIFRKAREDFFFLFRNYM